jgi:hypothetical protein
MKILFHLALTISFLFSFCIKTALAQKSIIPGTAVNYVPASTNTFVGSPSICILPDGDYVASHEFFGPASTEYKNALTVILKSNDKGKTWNKITEIEGQFWSNLFEHQGQLYIMGTWKHNGNFIIRRSTNNGKTWSKPNDEKTGLLLKGKYHTAPMPMTIFNDRIWRAIEFVIPYGSEEETHLCPMVISAPINSDLLNANNWKASNYIPFDPTLLQGKFNNWLEGNIVVAPNGELLNILRVATSEKGKELAAIVNISDDGAKISFDEKNGFIDFVGGASKFSIRYDKESNLYWAITNKVGDHINMDAAKIRNILVLKSSPDLKLWTIKKTLLHHPDIKTHGFQYIDWQFEGTDIIFLSRTAYDDEFGGAHNYHDANYITFHRIKNFRD